MPSLRQFRGLLSRAAEDWRDAVAALWPKAPKEGLRPLRIMRLERRRVLSADFTLVDGGLVLDGFDAAEGDSLTVVQTADEYRFVSPAGWSPDTGTLPEGFALDGQTLTADRALIDALPGGVTVEGADVNLVAAAPSPSVAAFALSTPVIPGGGLTLTSLTVSGDLNLFSNGPINDGPGTQITVTGNATFTTRGAGGINLADNPDDVLVIGGEVILDAIDGATRLDVSVGSAGRVELGDVTALGGQVAITERAGTRLEQIDADGFALTSAGVIDTTAGATIGVSGDALLTSTSAFNPADYNEDGVVDDADFDLLVANFGSVVTPGDPGDGNGDGVVDAADYTVYRDQLGQPGAPGGITIDQAATLQVDGQASFVASDAQGDFDILIGPDPDVQFGSLSATGATVRVHEDISGAGEGTLLTGVMADRLTLISGGPITDADNAVIEVAGDADFVVLAADDPFERFILLADAGADNRVVIGGVASFVSSNLIEVGSVPFSTNFQTGPPSDALFTAGGIRFSGEGFFGDPLVIIREDDSTRIASWEGVILPGFDPSEPISRNGAFSIDLFSAGSITDDPGVNLFVDGDSVLVAEESIVLADSAGDRFETINFLVVSDSESVDVGVDAAGQASGGVFEAFNLASFAAPNGDVRITTGGSLDLIAPGELSNLETVLGAGAPTSITAQTATLVANDIRQSVPDDIEISGNATFVSSGSIELSNAEVGGITTAVVETNGSISFGIDQFSGGDPLEDSGIFNTGSLRFSAPGGTVVVAEDSATVLADWQGASVPDISTPVENLTGTLTLLSAGSIADAPFAVTTVTGDAVIEAASTITLDNDDVNFGTLGVTGTDVLIREASGTNLTGVDATTFSLFANGPIVDDPGAVIAVSGAALIGEPGAAGNAITLDNASINFGTVGLTGTEVLLREASGTQLSLIQAETLDLVSAGAIEDLPDASIFVGGRTVIEGALGVTLADGGSLNEVQFSILDGFATVQAGAGQDISLGVDPARSLLPSEIVADANATFQAPLLQFSAPGGAVQVSDDGNVFFDSAILLVGQSEAETLLVQSAGAILDGAFGLPVADIEVTGDASFRAATGIVLADGATAGNRLVVAGLARFEVDPGNNIDVGVDITGAPADAVFIPGTLSVAAPGGLARVAVDSAAVLAGSNLVSDLRLNAAGAITDAADADTEVTSTTELVAGGGAADVVLGDESARFSLGLPTLFNPDEFLAIAANNVSVQADSAVNLRTSPLDPAFGGTFALGATGPIAQVGGANGAVTALAAERVSLDSEGAVLFSEIALTSIDDQPNLQVRAGEAIDLAGDLNEASLRTRFNADAIPSSQETPLSPVVVEADLADGTRPDQPIRVGANGLVDEGLEDVLFAGGPSRLGERAPGVGPAPTGFGVPVDIGDDFAVIVRVTGDAIVGDVPDATGAIVDTEAARGLVVASTGNAFLDTTGSLEFTGRGRFDTAASVDVVALAGGVLTAVAGTTLSIDTEEPDQPDPTNRTTRLRSATGTVTSIAPGEQSGLDAAPGPRVLLDTPTEEADAATTGLLRADFDFEQRITAAVGSRGEDNLLIEVEFADVGTVRNESAASVDAGVAPLRDSFDTAEVAGTREFADLIQTPVESIEALEASTAATGLDFQDLDGAFRVVTIRQNFQQEFIPANPAQDSAPTTVRVFNDPAINLFDQAGTRDLNSATLTVAPRIITLPPPGFFLISTPEAPTRFAPPEQVLAPSEPTAARQQTTGGETRAAIASSAETVEFGRVDDAGDWVQNIPGETWPQVREDAEGDFLREVRERIDEGPYSEGRYRIQVRTSRGELLLEEWTKTDSSAEQARADELEEGETQPDAAAEPPRDQGAGPVAAPGSVNDVDQSNAPKGQATAAVVAMAAVGGWHRRLITDGRFRPDDDGVAYTRLARRRRRMN